MAGTLWNVFVPVTKAKAGQVNENFDWIEGDLLPQTAGSTTDASYFLGTTTARWAGLHAQGLRIMASASSDTFFIDRTNGAIGIGTITPNTSSSVDFAKALPIILPRLTSAQQAAVTAANGMIIYNSDDNIFKIYENGAWVPMATSIRSIQRLAGVVSPNFATTTTFHATANITVTSVTTAKSVVVLTGLNYPRADTGGNPVGDPACYARLTSSTNVEIGAEMFPFLSPSSAPGGGNAVSTTVYFQVVEYY